MNFKYFSLFCLVILLLACPTPESPDSMDGKVVGVSDGDTLQVMQQGRAVKIRLYGIDCPEKAQDFGNRAKQFTSDQAFGQTVRVIEHDRDRYGRTVAEVILPDGRNLNEELVRAGLAWWYRDYARKEIRFENLENQARTEKKGLWRDKQPLPPWDFRKGERGGSEAGEGMSQGADTGKSNGAILNQTSIHSANTHGALNSGQVFITRTGKSFHRESCPSLRRSKEPISRQAALEKNYTPCPKCKP